MFHSLSFPPRGLISFYFLSNPKSETFCFLISAFFCFLFIVSTNFCPHVSRTANVTLLSFTFIISICRRFPDWQSSHPDRSQAGRIWASGYISRIFYDAASYHHGLADSQMAVKSQMPGSHAPHGAGSRPESARPRPHQRCAG